MVSTAFAGIVVTLSAQIPKPRLKPFYFSGIIKYPFWQMTDKWENASYACINAGDAAAPEEIKKKSICINGDIGEVILNL